MSNQIYAGTYKRSLNAAAAVKAAPGRLVRLIVTTAGSGGSMSAYDNASAASGTQIFGAPGTDPVGTIYTPDVPCDNGIYVTPATAQTLLVLFD